MPTLEALAQARLGCMSRTRPYGRILLESETRPQDLIEIATWGKVCEVFQRGVVCSYAKILLWLKVSLESLGLLAKNEC